METFKIVNGDLVDNDKGRFDLVSGANKAGQDMAEYLLSEYTASFQEGNELLNSLGVVGDVGEPLVVQYLTEAVNRLITKSVVNDFDEKIVGITQLRVQRVNLTSIVFFIEVEYSGGTRLSLVDTLQLEQVGLDHILNANTIARI